ncbi:hypothetical protein [Neptunomonas japonica]|uniref:hypothetical protein n=1 Tax=Neptunomonas japonica TaxID=417574 RepID=UPI0003F54BF9|nr:hypothetical protein [Neptunomonas japonica]
MTAFTVRFYHNGNLESYWQGEAYDELRALATALDKINVALWGVDSGMKVEIERN